MHKATVRRRLCQQACGLCLIALVVLWSVQAGLAEPPQPSEQERHSDFGGPDAVPNRLGSDRATTDAPYEFEFLKPYYDWKARIEEEFGFTFGLVYVPVFLKASNSLPGADDYAAGGVFRLFGSWELLGRGTDTTGTLNYLVEHRDRYADTRPLAFSIGNLGNVGALEIPFDDDAWHLTNLYWEQSWEGGQFVAVGGFLDITDFVDVHALTSPWTDFANFAFSIGAATMDVPDDASLGMAAGAWITDTTYLIAGFEDMRSDPNDPFKGFETFVSDHEYFKHIELGWAASQDAYDLDNWHLTLWHSDERDEEGVENGWGAVVSFSHTVGNHWLLFARAGYAEGGGSLLQTSVSAGAGYTPGGLQVLGSGSQLGFGFNWGRPNEAVFGSGLDDQYALEMYYRIQVTKELAITPSVQLLIHPALNPQEDTTWVGGARMRFAF